MRKDKKEMVLIPYNQLEELFNNSLAIAFEKNKPNQVTIDNNIELYTRKEVLALFHITSATLRAWVKNGILPASITKGRRVYFIKREIDEVLRKRLQS